MAQEAKTLTIAVLLTAQLLPIELVASEPLTLRYKCDFPRYASPEGLHREKNFKLEFIVETASDKAMMIGNAGFEQVLVVKGRYGVTFLEMLVTGAVQTTTVTNSDGEAVHSRHTIIGAQGKDLVPSQYYGNCDVSRSFAPFKMP